MKPCKRCGTEKPVDGFYSVDSTCKVCRRALVNENRKRNVDHYREYDRQRYYEAGYRYKDDIEVVRKRHQKTKKPTKIYRAKNPQKYAAHILLNNALKNGRIVGGTVCIKCGTAGKLHGHHEDYFAPLDVLWLCRSCHGKRHREINEAIRNGADWSDRGF